jgi:hypothetical protein
VWALREKKGGAARLSQPSGESAEPPPERKNVGSLPFPWLRRRRLVVRLRERGLRLAQIAVRLKVRKQAISAMLLLIGDVERASAR